MSFDLARKFKENLPGWRERLTATAVNSSYAMITAAALWPVAAALQDGSLAFSSAGLLLGGSVGGNLIANFIERWRDEADGARLTSELPPETNLRPHLDALLERLEGFVLAQKALPAADRAWLATSLPGELEGLGNRERFKSQLASLQSQARVTVEGNRTVSGGDHSMVIGGDVHGNLTMN